MQVSLIEWRIKLIVNITTFVLGLIGNATVLWMLKKHKTKSQRPPFEYFIVNLSIADIIFGIMLFIEEYLGVPRSQFVCKAIIPIVSVAFQAGMHTVVAIAIFRCKAILSPFPFKPAKRNIFGTIAAIWIFAHVAYIPFYLVMYYDDGNCEEFWPSQTLNKLYTVALSIIHYVIPIVIIIICYAKIGVFLKKQAMPQSGHGRGNQLQLARKRKQDRLVMKIAVIIIVLYTLLTLPTQLAWIGWIVFDYEPIKDVIFMFSNELLLAHASCNPIVYGVLSKQFRRQLVITYRALCLCKNCKRNRVRSLESTSSKTVTETPTR